MVRIDLEHRTKLTLIIQELGLSTLTCYEVPHIINTSLSPSHITIVNMADHTFPPSTTAYNPNTNVADMEATDGGNGYLRRGEDKLAGFLELPSELRNFMLLDALNLDPRPTFVLSLVEETLSNVNIGLSKLVFCNNALNSLPALCHVIKAQQKSILAAWSSNRAAEDESGELNSSRMLFGLCWDTYTLNGRWRVASTTISTRSKDAISATSLDGSSSIESRSFSPSTPVQQAADILGRKSKLEIDSHQLSLVESAPYFRGDLTPAFSSDFGQLLCGFDWGTTLLGPMHSWSQQLIEMFKLMLTDPRPAMLFWGPHNVMLYNEAVVPLMQDRHPGSIGLTVEQIYKDVWEDLHKPLIARIIETAEAQTHFNTLLCYVKNDFLEEVYADFTSIPVIGPDGHVTGVYQSIVVVTEHTLTQRRTNTLSALATVSAHSRDLKEIWEKAMTVLKENDKDIPQMILYSLTAKWGEKTTHSKCKLEGLIRWAPSSKIAFDNFRLHDQEHVISKLFEQSMTSDKPLYLQQHLPKYSNSYLSYIFDGFEPGPFGDPCNRAVVFPIRASSTDEPVGFVVWGLNSRQPYNENYELFVSLLQQALATTN